MNQENTNKRPIWAWITTGVAIIFGVATLKSGGQVLFGEEAARQAAGAYVPFVLWFNFIAGFFYIVTGLGLWLQRSWAVWLALGLAAATALVFAAFGVYILNDGAYEVRTVGAMVLRTFVWVVIGLVAWKKSQPE